MASLARGWPSPSTRSDIVVDPMSGIDLVFGITGNAAWATRNGWSVPEVDAQWSVGPRSELVLPASAGRELVIELAPFVHADRLPRQRIALFAADICVGQFDLADHAVIAMTLPEPAPGARLALRFDAPDAASPAGISALADDRVLGFSFRRLFLAPKAAEVSAAPPPPGPAEASDRTMPVGALMSLFESLGENCEFGLVQRRCGVEPLGLLRFASAPLPKLRAALRTEFEGLGRAENIDVQISANGHEYMVHDRAFGLNYHAWVKVEEQTADEIAAREARRLPFLVRKLIEDLQSGEKIFVFHAMQPLTLANARDLRADLGRYGPGVLLWVELAEAGHPPGSVEWIDAGLLKGYMDRFAPGEDAHDLSLPCWVDLCHGALAAVSAARSAVANSGGVPA